MRKFALFLALLFGALATSGAPTEALPVSWNFATGSSTPSTSSGSGFGNFYTFTSGGITVNVTSWGLTGSGTTFQTGELNRTSFGLGSCNRGEGTGCTGDSQRVDNVSQLEFLLFQFTSAVNGLRVVIDPGGTSFDRDVSYWVGNLSGSLAGQGLSGLTGLGFGSQQNVSNSSGSSPLTISLSGGGTSLLFGARTPLDDDRFYVKSLTAEPVAPEPVPTPEPGTLALLGTGLVGLGTTLRRKWMGTRRP